MILTEDARPRHHPRAASRLFEGEVVIVHPDTNMVRMLNPVGSRIWELADGTRTLREIAATLVEEFEVEATVAQQSVTDFVEELRSKDILTLV